LTTSFSRLPWPAAPSQTVFRPIAANGSLSGTSLTILSG
jgi:hypothetical protein